MRFLRFPTLVMMAISLAWSSDTTAQTFKEELVRAARAEVTGDGFKVGGLKLDSASAGPHELQLTVTSLREMPHNVRLTVSVFPGLGDAHTKLEQIRTIEPQERQVLTDHFTLKRLTPFSRVTLVLASYLSGDGDEINWQQIFRSRIFLGIGNPAVNRDFPELVRTSSRHVDGYFVPGTAAAQNIDDILAVREEAISRISAILGTTINGRIRLFLYPDAEIKYLHTGHQGMGWAYGDFIAEIYNQSYQLDPVHEVAHILTGQLGLLPAFLDEGFATYISESFGEDALEFLGSKGRNVDEVAAELVAAGRSLPIRELVALENIGSSQASSQIEYPQSASLVKFIVESYGSKAVSHLFKAFGPGGATPDQAVVILERSLGISIDDLQKAWVRTLANNDGL